jgi:hypothetical protein
MNSSFQSRWRRLLDAARRVPVEPPESAPLGLAGAVVARWQASCVEPSVEWLVLLGRRAFCTSVLVFAVSLGLAGWVAASDSPLEAWLENTLIFDMPLP